MGKGLLMKKAVRYLKVSCLSGACWITWQGSEDIILQAGESLEVRDVKRFCLEFLKEGEACLQEGGEKTRTVSRFFSSGRAASFAIAPPVGARS